MANFAVEFWRKMPLTLFPNKGSLKISFQTSPEIRHQFRRKLRQLHSGNRWCLNIAQLSRDMLQNGVSHRCACVKLSTRAIWGIAAIVSQYRAIWGLLMSETKAMVLVFGFNLPFLPLSPRTKGGLVREKLKGNN